MKYIVFLFFCVVLILEFLHPLYAFSQDLGRHLTLGKIIIDSHHIPATNLFSYTYPNFPFINTHWLSEVIFFLIVHAVGLQGLLFYTIFVVLTTYAILFFSSKKISSIALGITSLFFVGIFIDRNDIRPELLSFLFLALFLALLFKNKQSVTKWILLLPLLELVWVNIHIYFFIGAIVVGLFLIDACIERYIFHKEKSPTLLALVFFLTCLATFGNPHFLSGALYPLFVFQNYGYTIAENQNAFFLQSVIYVPGVGFFETAAIILGLLLLLQWKKTRPIDWLLYGTFTYLGISAARNTPLFALTTFTTFVYLLTHAQEYIQKLPRVAMYKHILAVLACIGIIGVAVWEIMLFTTIRPVGISIVASGDRALSFFEKNHIHGPIFNNFDIGSYIIYRLYPREKVFVDGRPEAYPANFFQNIYIPMQEDQTLFEKIDNAYHFNAIIFSDTDMTPWGQNFLIHVVQNKNWRLVYLDENMIILVKNSKANTYLTQLTESNFVPKKSSNTNAQLRFSLFLDEIDWKDAEKNILQNVLNQNPSSCPALYQLGKLYNEENNNAMADIYATRYLTSCK